MVPDRTLCLETLESEGVPPHIRDHSLLVARVAITLGGALTSAGNRLDLALLEAGALLHDISKYASIKGGGNHALLGGERVVELGFEELAPLVARHVDIGSWEAEGPVTEAELVNYSDKRVKHVEIVSLVERFDDLVTRYGRTEKAVEKITEHRHTLFAIEKKIFALLGVSPESFPL